MSAVDQRGVERLVSRGAGNQACIATREQRCARRRSLYSTQGRLECRHAARYGREHVGVRCVLLGSCKGKTLLPWCLAGVSMVVRQRTALHSCSLALRLRPETLSVRLYTPICAAIICAIVCV